jgi:hypothetical protein
VTRTSVSQRERTGDVLTENKGFALFDIQFLSAFHWAVRPAVGADSFPHLQTMDGNVLIDLEAQSHLSALDLEHGDFKQMLEAIGASDHDCFLTFP